MLASQSTKIIRDVEPFLAHIWLPYALDFVRIAAETPSLTCASLVVIISERITAERFVGTVEGQPRAVFKTMKAIGQIS
jgi:hypothetical protein